MSVSRCFLGLNTEDLPFSALLKDPSVQWQSLEGSSVLSCITSLGGHPWTIYIPPESAPSYFLAEAPADLPDEVLPPWAEVEAPPGLGKLYQELSRDSSAVFQNLHESIVIGTKEEAHPGEKSPLLYTTTRLPNQALKERILQWMQEFLASPEGACLIYVRQTAAGAKLAKINPFAGLSGKNTDLGYLSWYAASVQFLRNTKSPEVWIVLPPGTEIHKDSTLRRLEYALILANPYITHVRFIQLIDHGADFDYKISEPQPKEVLKASVSGHHHLVNQRQPMPELIRAA